MIPHTTHDTHHVDAFLDAQEKALDAQEKAWKIARINHMLKGLSIFIIACSIAFVLIAIGIYIIHIKTPKDPQQATISLLEKYDQSKQNANVVSNYTIFHTNNSLKTLYGWSVVTGWKFENNEKDIPQYQYCYIEKRIYTYEIEFRDDMGNVNINTDYSDYDELKLNSTMIEKFRKLCLWFSKDAPSVDDKNGTDDTESPTYQLIANDKFEKWHIKTLENTK